MIEIGQQTSLFAYSATIFEIKGVHWRYELLSAIIGGIKGVDRGELIVVVVPAPSAMRGTTEC